MKLQGFFPTKTKQPAFRGNKKLASCASCGLFKGVQSPQMEAYGKFKKGILNVGEAPGETEDRRGKQWQGKMGKELQDTYRGLGIDLFEDCLNINAINCRPVDKDGTNRTPTSQEIACCHSRVMSVIEEHKPRMIVALGGAAVESLLLNRWKKDLGGISKWRGWIIPDRDFNARICPVFHPSFVHRGEKKEAETIWTQDLKRALHYLDSPFPKWKDERGQIEIIDDLRVLGDLSGTIAIDYETTGLKPHAVGHQIVCASVADRDDHSFSFLLPDDPDKRRPLIKLIRNPRIEKIAQNIKFEEAWSVHKLGYPIKNWTWDTMLAAHVLDNRTGITGLKFQVYINFGLPDYDSEIEPYLKAKGGDGGNGFNRILELLKLPGGKEKLLTYCGMDSLFERRIAMKQMRSVKG
jgi:uracil-DNA glycosylase